MIPIVEHTEKVLLFWKIGSIYLDCTQNVIDCFRHVLIKTGWIDNGMAACVDVIG